MNLDKNIAINAIDEQIKELNTIKQLMKRDHDYCLIRTQLEMWKKKP